ncbi:MAG: hypothetical protein KJS97_13105 [Alphaproteobacteria bacterium]|nr:hypothetical protein [Alphaproteobacteria bacterium]
MIVAPMPRGRDPIHATVESCLRLDVAEPAVRQALLPGAVTSGSWRWTSFGSQIGAIGYEWNGTARVLELHFSVDGTPVRQTILTDVTSPRFGGSRLWFVCPRRGTNVRALVLPPGGRLFLSRSAWRVVYQSTRDSGLEQALVRALGRTPGLGFNIADLKDEGRWERRCASRDRRNHVRRLRRAERKQHTSLAGSNYHTFGTE